ncbi:MAG: PspC domain-containing protein [Rhodanobacteraceae bacterium]
MNHSRDEHCSRPFFRNPERGVILGVCAGIAESFEWPLWMTRMGALAVGWFFPVTAVVAYVGAALILPERPLRYCGDGDERRFWQSRSNRS